MDPYLPKTLCVLRLSALGDCISAFGMMGGIKKAYPKVKITWIIDERFAPLFINRDREDLIPLVTVNYKKYGFKAFSRLRKELKGREFDCLLNIQTSLKASMTSLAVNANVKYGYDSSRSREGQRFFTDLRVPSPDDPHVLAGFMAFAHEAGFTKAEPYWDFDLQDNEREEALSRFDKDSIFLISPCSSKAAKNWTVEGYTAIARHALEQGFAVGLVGGDNATERAACTAIEKALDGQCVNLCGQTTLRQLLAVVSVASLVLCPDSGTLHLANALNVPVIGLFAIHSEKSVGPTRFMDLCVSIHEQLAREELGDREIPWRYRVKKENAMQLITPDMVLPVFNRAVAEYVLPRLHKDEI